MVRGQVALQQVNKTCYMLAFPLKATLLGTQQKDNQKYKYMFACNKVAKMRITARRPPCEQRNRSIPVKTDCRARLRVKRIEGQVTMFVEERTYALIKKFSFKR